MKLLIVNPILYTSDTKTIQRAKTIKDTMIYDLCLAFMKQGAEVTLFAGEPYKPTEEEEYPFEVIWAKCILPKIFQPHAIPFCPAIKRVVKERRFDMIISSEVLSVNSFLLTLQAKDRLIIWHELAYHHKIMKQIPSKLWYHTVAKTFFNRATIVARSPEARAFISKYCRHVSDTVIEHGVNFDKFKASKEKQDYFIVIARLIESKRLDKIITQFHRFVQNGHPDYQLYFFGGGEKEKALKSQTAALGLTDNITFFGNTPHHTLTDYLAQARALLIYTEKDNSMISIIESIACGTPIITTSVPNNATYIRQYALGIVDDNWTDKDLEAICAKGKEYIQNCLDYRKNLSTESKAEAFLSLMSE